MQRVKFLVVMLIVGCFCPAVFAQKDVQGGLSRDRERARDLFAKEKYAAAQYLYDKVVKSDPSDGEACYYGAVCSGKLDNNDAPYRLEEFLRQYPQSSRCNMARFYLGCFYYSRGDYEKSLSYYEQVKGSEVEYGQRSEYEFKKGYCYFVGGKTAQAKDVFSRLSNGSSKYKSSALYYYAHIQYMDGQYELSLKNFQKLKTDKKFAKIVPSYEARIYYYLGREDELLEMAPALLQEKDVFKKDEIAQMVAEVYFNRADYKNALKFYHQVEALQPSNQVSRNASGILCTPQDNHYQMGYCHYMEHQYDSASLYLAMKTACTDSVAQNALYTLGDCYVKMDRKQDARSSFLQASQLNFDKKIKEDALFNYAKLSCELNANPYNESIRSFQNYLKLYPKTPHKTEIQEILTSLYMTTRNYKDALTLIEKIENRNAALNKAYQRIVVNRGIELFNSGDIEKASEYFLKAIKINAVPQITTDAGYLLGETQYRLGNIEKADRAIDRFFLSSGAKKSPYYNQALYTYGYVCMKQQKYDDAASNFDQFVKAASSGEDRQKADACNRLGDCSYVGMKYNEAISHYDKTIAMNGYDADYATYQKALCYGALGKSPEKLATLSGILERYKNSSYCSKATMEIANTYMVLDNNEMAALYYGNFVSQYPNSANVKVALLKMGLVYYNTEQNEKALRVFDTLLNNYPGTEEAKDALAAVKNIYVSENRVDEYFAYVKKTTKMTVSTAEQDSTTFVAVQNKYMEGDCDASIKGFENYLKKYGHGLYTLKAHYYLADCLYRTEQYENALPHYEYVANAGRNQYTETALMNAAQIAYQAKDYAKASKLYGNLYRTAESESNRMAGCVGQMRSCSESGDHIGLMTASQQLLLEGNITEELRDEALLDMARSCYENSLLDSADMYYSQLMGSTNGEWSGEASYSKAEILFGKKDYDGAERMIEDIIGDPRSDYWLAKTFILWADIYYARGNNMQAKQTLQSIIDNYDGADLVELSRQKYNAILEAEAAIQQPEEKPVVIDINEVEGEAETEAIEIINE